MPLTEAQQGLAEMIRNTAVELWDVSETITSTQTVRADDWEAARLTASHLLVALERPPLGKRSILHATRRPPLSAVSSR